jgi:hypothetical protein
MQVFISLAGITTKTPTPGMVIQVVLGDPHMVANEVQEQD